MKKYKVILGLVVLCTLVVLVVFSFLNKSKIKGDDYRIGIFADDGIAMVSISKSRNMINFLKTTSESKVWIPQGMGWYRSEVVKKFLIQENKKDLYDDILFYNFGFVADRIVNLKKVDDWRSKFWWKIKVRDLISKSEVLNGDSDMESDWLNEIMLRDFSETKVFDGDLKLSVINASGENGLASFITNDLERLGFSVVSISSGESDEVEGCIVLFGDGVEGTYSWGLLEEIFGKCEFSNDSSLNKGEVELYFDDKFASVIKYSTYKK